MHLSKLKLLLSFLLIMVFSFSAMAGKKKILVSCSEPDASIYANGIKVGTGQAEVIVLGNSCITINIEKIGFLDIEDLLWFQKEREEGNLPVVEVKFKLADQIINTTMLVSKKLNRRHHKIEIGRKDLKNFIIQLDDNHA